MKLRFYCYDCGTRYIARAADSGRRFSCKRCGWPCRVPRRSEPLPVREAAAQADRPAVARAS